MVVFWLGGQLPPLPPPASYGHADMTHILVVGNWCSLKTCTNEEMNGKMRFSLRYHVSLIPFCGVLKAKLPGITAAWSLVSGTRFSAPAEPCNAMEESALRMSKSSFRHFMNQWTLFLFVKWHASLGPERVYPADNFLQITKNSGTDHLFENAKQRVRSRPELRHQAMGLRAFNSIVLDVLRRSELFSSLESFPALVRPHHRWI